MHACSSFTMNPQLAANQSSSSSSFQADKKKHFEFWCVCGDCLFVSRDKNETQNHINTAHPESHQCTGCRSFHKIVARRSNINERLYMFTTKEAYTAHANQCTHLPKTSAMKRGILTKKAPNQSETKKLLEQQKPKEDVAMQDVFNEILADCTEDQLQKKPQQSSSAFSFDDGKDISDFSLNESNSNDD